MKDLYTIIDEQALLLQWNGYDERTLNNFEVMGSYKEQLKLAVQELLDSKSTIIDKELFHVHLFGYFDQGKDVVHFMLTYEYDPSLTQISLKEIEARLNTIPITIPIEFGSDLWKSTELYQRVKQLSDGITTTIQLERSERLEGLINQEIEKLKDCSYTTTTIKSHLLTAIAKAESTSGKEIHSFVMNGKIVSNSHDEPMYYRLHYDYHPENITLQLKSVHARVGKTARTFLGTSSFPIPPAIDIHQYLINLKGTNVIQKPTPDNTNTQKNNIHR